MNEKIPVNSDILKWARQTAGMSLDDVAHKMGKAVEIITSWEQGNTAPTYIQLEKLAYRVFKRPLAVFFFPEPPEEETPEQSFRTLPAHEIEMLSPRMYYLIKQARVMQINLSELNIDTNPAKRNIIDQLTFQPTVPVKAMADRVREYLGIGLDAQFAWKTRDDAFNAWRNALQEHGVYIFKDAFKDDAYSGFCLYHETFPIIYINNSTPKSRQIFTIFHELAHLLFRTGGIDTRKDHYINHLKGDNKRIEILCNQFAGAFLVPGPDFSRRIATIAISDDSVRELADKYSVSREVILRKCLDMKRITREYYSQRSEQWIEEAKNRPASTGGNYYATKGAYLGEGYLALAFSRYFQNKITSHQLADYLGVKVKNISGMEAVLFNMGKTA